MRQIPSMIVYKRYRERTSERGNVESEREKQRGEEECGREPS